MIDIQYHLFHRQYCNKSGRDIISFSVLCPEEMVIYTFQIKALTLKKHLNKLNKPYHCSLVDLQFKFRLTETHDCNYNHCAIKPTM